MQYAKASFLSFLFLGFFGNAGSAHAETTFNFLVSPEFGRGLGAGFEFGQENSLVLGLGAQGGIGYSSSEGIVGGVKPGIAAGYRRYLGNWYFGPSLGVNYLALSTGGHGDHPRASTLLDAGYRWKWKNRPTWNTKLGLGGGAQWWPGEDVSPEIGLTVSIGFGL